MTNPTPAEQLAEWATAWLTDGAGYTYQAAEAKTRALAAEINTTHPRHTDDLATLAAVGRLYLDALDNDPDHEYLTLGEALQVTAVREAVERHEASQQPAEPEASPTPPTLTMEIRDQHKAAAFTIATRHPSVITITDHHGHTLLIHVTLADTTYMPPTAIAALPDDRYPLTVTITSQTTDNTIMWSE